MNDTSYENLLMDYAENDDQEVSANTDRSISPMFAPKIDAWSAVFTNVPFRAVLEYLHLPKLIGGYFEETAPDYQNQDFPKAVFTFNLIRFEFRSAEYNSLRQHFQDSWMDAPCPWVRIAMMGQALNYLRANDVDVDTVLRRQEEWCKLTRVDIAFDFINYNPKNKDILTALDNFVRQSTSLTKSGRICVEKRKGGISFTKVFGSNERTFRIGVPSSDKFLRIYDKKLERVNAGGGTFLSDGVYEDEEKFDSWVRVEWVLRNTVAQKIFYGSTPDNDGYLAILSELYKMYKFLYFDTGGEFKIWQRYFDPANLGSLVCVNINLVYKHIAPMQTFPTHYGCSKIKIKSSSK